jgi:hypothetical protein
MTIHKREAGEHILAFEPTLLQPVSVLLNLGRAGRNEQDLVLLGYYTQKHQILGTFQELTGL